MCGVGRDLEQQDTECGLAHFSHMGSEKRKPQDSWALALTCFVAMPTLIL